MNCQNCQTPLVGTVGSCCGMLYCNRDCQKADWKRHKPTCTRRRPITLDLTPLEFMADLNNWSSRQDAYKTFKTDKVVGITVCDGHGKHDKDAVFPKTAAEVMTDMIVSGDSFENPEDNAKKIENICLDECVKHYGVHINEDGVPMQYGSVFHTGTTLSTLAVYADRVECYNAGDSQVVFYYEMEGEVHYEILSADHTPSTREAWRQLETAKKEGTQVGTLMWKKKNDTKIPIFNALGEEIDYGIEAHRPVKEATKQYFHANDNHLEDPNNPEKKKIMEECLKKYQNAYTQYQQSPMANIQEYIAVADVEGDHSCYLVGDRTSKYGRDTELAMMVKIGDVHANHCGAKTSITKTVRPMSSFPKAEKRAFVVASDGVWDCVRLLQFGKFVLNKPSKTALTIFIDREAQKTFGKHRDDFVYGILYV